MPSGPVYQPTTVSYEPRSCGNAGVGGGGPLGLGNVPSMRVDSPLRVFRKRRPQVALLVFAVISLIAGVAMLASCSSDWMHTEDATKEGEQQQLDQQQQQVEDDTFNTCTEVPFGVIIGGFLMIFISLIAFGMYLKFANWRRSCACVCPCDKKQSFARQIQCQRGDGCGQNVIAPSSDPLVSHTQYAPISELPRPEDEERRNLMPDNKDCLSSLEESDRMLEQEPDRRIVLRPMERLEDA